jgi:hypothetical protein
VPSVEVKLGMRPRHNVFRICSRVSCAPRALCGAVDVPEMEYLTTDKVLLRALLAAQGAEYRCTAVLARRGVGSRSQRLQGLLQEARDHVRALASLRRTATGGRVHRGEVIEDGWFKTGDVGLWQADGVRLHQPYPG